MSFRLFTHRLFRHGRYFFTNYRNIRRDIHLNIFEKRELSSRSSGTTSAASPGKKVRMGEVKDCCLYNNNNINDESSHVIQCFQVFT